MQHLFENNFVLIENHVLVERKVGSLDIVRGPDEKPQAERLVKASSPLYLDLQSSHDIWYRRLVQQKFFRDRSAD